MRKVLALLLLSSCAAPESASTRNVDLLKLIDPSRDSIVGAWTFDGSTLVTPNAKFGRVQILYAPPEEYDLRLEAERTEGSDSIILGLVSGGHPFMVAIDAFTHDPSSGVELIDGKSFADNETAVPGRLLENGKRAAIVVAVRRESLAVTVNGRKLIEWKGESERLSLHAKWKMRRADALWLGAFACVWRVHSLALIPITGEGRRL